MILADLHEDRLSELAHSILRGLPAFSRINTVQQTLISSNTTVHLFCPQRDEFKLKGMRFDAAVLENVDGWPIVEGPDGEGMSTLVEEVLAYTHGPILFTFSEEGCLPESLRGAISPLG